MISPPWTSLVLVAFNATCRRVSNTAFSSICMSFHMPRGPRSCFALRLTRKAMPSLGNGWSVILSDQVKHYHWFQINSPSCQRTRTPFSQTKAVREVEGVDCSVIQVTFLETLRCFFFSPQAFFLGRQFFFFFWLWWILFLILFFFLWWYLLRLHKV